MVGQYVFGLRPFLQSQLPVQQYHTMSCSVTLSIHQKTKWLKQAISYVRTAVVALSEPVPNTKLTYAMRYARALMQTNGLCFLATFCGTFSFVF